MRHEDAVRAVRHMLTATQRLRRSMLSAMQAEEEELASIMPWAFGPKSVVPGLNTVLRRVEGGGELTPQEFYNFMYIAHYLQPEIPASTPHLNLPKPTIEWIMGWDDQVDVKQQMGMAKYEEYLASVNDQEKEMADLEDEDG